MQSSQLALAPSNSSQPGLVSHDLLFVTLHLPRAPDRDRHLQAGQLHLARPQPPQPARPTLVRVRVPGLRRPPPDLLPRRRLFQRPGAVLPSLTTLPLSDPLCGIAVDGV